MSQFVSSCCSESNQIFTRKCRPVWRALVRVRSGREEGERRSDRQFTEILTRKKTVRTTVRTTEVGFENAEDLELSDL